MCKHTHSLLAACLLAFLLAVLPGCAGKNAAQAEAQAAESTEYPLYRMSDPLEPWNRFWFGFNDVVYTGLARPVTTAYTTVTPKYLRERVENAYANILFPVRFVNALLQLRPDKASRELGRFIINSTFGLGGLYDLAASDPDMHPQQLDFGQTLGVWGVEHGFYLVLPLLGPSSLRDAVGLAADAAILPTSYVDVPFLLTAGISGVGRFNRLDEALSVYYDLKNSALEPYTAARDAYMQLRAKIIQDARRSAWITPKEQTPAP